MIQVYSIKLIKPTGKYLAAFSSPFDLQFKDTVEEIERLEKMLEYDAVAVGLLQMQQGLSAMAEWVLGSHHQTQLRTNIQQANITALLLDFRNDLFKGREMETTYQQDIVNLYNLTSTSDWDQWFALERKYVSWSPLAQSNLIHMQTDLIEPQLYCKWIALGRALAGAVPFVQLVWCPSMTAYSALASMVIQILEQRPELLSEESRISHRVKSRRTNSVHELWSLFQDMLSVLSGLLCYITIASIGPQEEAFVAQILQLLNSWRGSPINIQLVTPLHSTFPKPAGFLDIDAFYDVSPDLDSTDAIHQVVLAEVGIPKQVSEQMKTSLWQSAWRTVSYATNRLALKQVQLALRRVVNELSNADSEAYTRYQALVEWSESRVGEQLLRANLQHCGEQLPFMLPSYLRSRFETSVHSALRRYMSVEKGPQTPNAGTFRKYNFPGDVNSRRMKPTVLETRKHLWREIQLVLDYEAADTLCPFILRKLLRRDLESVTPLAYPEQSIQNNQVSRAWEQEILEGVFSCPGWMAISKEVGYQYLRAVGDAVETGLQQTVQVMFE